MKTFSQVAIATLTMVGVASAQQPKAPEKAPAPAPTTPAPAKADPKAPAPAAKAPAPAPAAKAPDKAPAPAAKLDPNGPGMKAPAPKPAMPPPPAEVEAMAKSAVGLWRCKGDEWDSMSGSKTAMTATNAVKLDLDKWWIAESMDAKGRMPFKMVAYTTYDPSSKKWRRLAVMNGGSQMIGTSDGMKDNKMTWNLDMIGPMGAGMFRDHMDLTDPKAGMRVWGEASMDKGKNWVKVYEMTCKK